jgi:hypothetical protein
MYEPDPESLDLAEAIRKGLIPTIPGFLEEMIRQKPPLPKETKSKYSEKAPAAGPRERATREARRNVLSVPNAVGRKLARHFDPSAGAHLHQPTGVCHEKTSYQGGRETSDSCYATGDPVDPRQGCFAVKLLGIQPPSAIARACIFPPQFARLIVPVALIVKLQAFNVSGGCRERDFSIGCLPAPLRFEYLFR